MKRAALLTGAGCSGALVIAIAAATGLAEDAKHKNAAKTADAKFLKCAAEANLFEIQLSQLVAERAEQDKVKSFAKAMVDAHTKANQKVMQRAQQQNLQISENLNEWQQAKLKHVSKLDAADLGRLYIFHQVGAHHMQLLEHQYQMHHGTDNAVKQLASSMVPELESHLKQAQQIASGIAGTELRGTPISDEVGNQKDREGQQQLNQQNDKNPQDQPQTGQDNR